MPLQDEIKIDFAGAAQLAANMRAAQAATAQFRRDMLAIRQDTQQVSRQLAHARMPGLPTNPAQMQAQALRDYQRTQTADRLALAGTAAAGSTLFFRSTQLANPAAMQRFHDAIEDTTAVIGHRMIPALEKMTKWVRGVGDFLANHPTVASGIGYGTLGLAGLATVGAAYGIGKMAVRGGISAYRDVRGALGYGPAASDSVQAAASIAGGQIASRGGGGISRAALAAAQIESFRAEERITARIEEAKRAERASGGLGGSPESARARSEAEAELAALRANRNRATPPPLPSERRSGGRFGTAAASVPFLPFVVMGAEALNNTFNPPPETRVNNGVTSRTGRPNWFDRTVDRGLEMGFGHWGHNKFDEFLYHAGLSDITPRSMAAEARKSSLAAAARPAQYTDALSSIFQMRQAIASGAGNDPASQTAANTKRTADAVEKLAGSNSGNGTGGDPWDKFMSQFNLSNYKPSDRSTRRE